MTLKDKLKRLVDIPDSATEGGWRENRRLAPLLDALIECVGGLDKIKSGGGRAEIFGLELYRCPTCASAEIASEALANLERVVKEME